MHCAVSIHKGVKTPDGTELHCILARKGLSITFYCCFLAGFANVCDAERICIKRTHFGSAFVFLKSLFLPLCFLAEINDSSTSPIKPFGIPGLIFRNKCIHAAVSIDRDWMDGPKLTTPNPAFDHPLILFTRSNFQQKRVDFDLFR